LRDALAVQPASLVIAVGPEAGFADDEEAAMDAAGFVRVHLGPRILRTETVAPAMLAAISALAGDWR
jgi:16S rRNA (uracil1498-N3)-methyltransferase